MCCKASVTTCISDPCLLWLGWPVKDAWEQLRLQLTGNTNATFEEEVKLCSEPYCYSASPTNTTSGAIRSSKLLLGVKPPIFKQDSRVAPEELLPMYLSITEILDSPQPFGSGLVVVWRVLAAQTTNLLQTHRQGDDFCIHSSGSACRTCCS